MPPLGRTTRNSASLTNITSKAKHNSVTVGGMAEAAYGMETLRRIHDEKLRNYVVLFYGPWSLSLLREVITFCKEHNLRFVMDETWQRLNPMPQAGYKDIDPHQFRSLIASAGDCYGGALFMCEYGGVALYWPDAGVKNSANLIPSTPCAAEASSYFVAKLNLKRAVELSRMKL